MYKKVETDFAFAEREKEVLAFWKENKIFEKSVVLREGAKNYTFYDGPPTANGKPHIGHVLTRAVKDLIPRYKTMKGYNVLRKAGWDTHGLPVELEVEKLLGLDGKEQIEQYGVEPFIEKCKESVWKYKEAWREMSDRVGYWADMDHPYVTYDNEYIESEWWALKTIWDKGLLYKGYKIVPYCPRCGTALSSHEVSQGYKDVCEKSIFVRFAVKDQENTFFLAWTTTPWTLPSNVALAVHPQEIYVDVVTEKETLIMAKALVGAVMGEGDYEVCNERPGKALEYIQYQPLFDFAEPEKKAYYVVCADYVTMSDGSGIVHTAPAFGEDDASAGRAYDLPFVQMVDAKGEFVEAVAPWKGLFVKQADPLIIEDLEERGLLFRAMDYEHSYPFCWRCDTPLIYYARNTWFIEMTRLRDRLLANNQTVNWMPENIKNGRFGNFLDNVVDWGLSRERYWGTPLPVWECGCGHREAVGSIAQLRDKGHMQGGAPVPENIELHKPYIDQVYLHCDTCGGEMKRVSEVIDCWFDSGSMPFAQWHYPFENKELFERLFPADFISEAIDQTRGWFYTLIAIATLLFDESPYKNVIVLGHVQDKDGKKMSKHLHNVVDPAQALAKQGADAVRWYFYANSSPWLPSRYHDDAVGELQRKFMGTLHNTYAFYVLYAQIDGFKPAQHALHKEQLCVMDRWILSLLNSLIKKIDALLDAYKITEAARELQSFVDTLSNWYVRCNRKRFWQTGMEVDKENAFMTLFTVLQTLVRLCAPFTPFMAEEIYQNIVRGVDASAPESVHLSDFPAADESMIDSGLEAQMTLTESVTALARTCRNEASIKIRQPLSTLYIQCEQPLDCALCEIIKEEVNVKETSAATDMSRFFTYRFKPQLKTVGPKYGKMVGKINQWLAGADGDAAMAELNETGSLTQQIEGTDVTLAKEDLLIEQIKKEGFVSQSEGGLTVALVTALDECLIEEGYLREVISKIQTMRKNAGYEVTDRILFGYETAEPLGRVIAEHLDYIAGETLIAGALDATGKDGAYTAAWDINGLQATFYLRKA